MMGRFPKRATVSEAEVAPHPFEGLYLVKLDRAPPFQPKKKLAEPPQQRSALAQGVILSNPLAALKRLASHGGP